MSAYTDITITDESAQSNVMETISVVDEKSVRKDFTKGRATPFTMTHSHQKTGTGNNVVDRHLVRLDEVVADTEIDDVSVISQSAYVVFETPRRVFTEAQVQSIAEKLCNYVMANVSAILKGKL